MCSGSGDVLMHDVPQRVKVDCIYANAKCHHPSHSLIHPFNAGIKWEDREFFLTLE